MLLKWRVIPLEEHSGFLNMALDDAAGEALARGEVSPTIRFYTWQPSTVSIGYFQSMKEEVNLDACRELGVSYLRRRTGGGAVYHDSQGEITYSVIAPQQLFPRDILKSYEVICTGVVKALELLGIEAEFKPVNDILVEGRKISGSAQTRRNRVLIQHGTVLYDLDVEKMFRVLRVGKEKISDKDIKKVEERVTCIKRHTQVSREELYQALVAGFTLDKNYEIGEWTHIEKERASELARTRYQNKEWNHQR